jgi:hypothetical protein
MLDKVSWWFRLQLQSSKEDGSQLLVILTV